MSLNLFASVRVQTYFVFISCLIFITYFLFFLDYLGVTFWIEDFLNILIAAAAASAVTLLFACLYLIIVLCAQSPVGREYCLTKRALINPIRGMFVLSVCLVFSFIHGTVLIIALFSNEITPEFFSKFLLSEFTAGTSFHVYDAGSPHTRVLPSEYFKSLFFYRASLVFQHTDEFVLFVFYVLFSMFFCAPYVSACVNIRRENLEKYIEMKWYCKRVGIEVDYDYVYRASLPIFLTRFPLVEETLRKKVPEKIPDGSIAKNRSDVQPTSPMIHDIPGKYVCRLTLVDNRLGQ